MEKVLYAIKIELLEDLLGTVPKNKAIYASYIASKAEELIGKGIPHASGDEATDGSLEAMAAEEVSTITEIEERGWTGFHEDEGGPFLYDYVIRGFLCESARTMKTWGTLKQLQDKFKRYVFVSPRRIRLPRIAGVLERPLRCMTPQGPRVTLVRSDVIKAGTQLDFDLTVLSGSGLGREVIAEVLSYGEFMGLGQWRTGSWGRFRVLSMEKQ